MMLKKKPAEMYLPAFIVRVSRSYTTGGLSAHGVEHAPQKHRRQLLLHPA